MRIWLHDTDPWLVFSKLFAMFSCTELIVFDAIKAFFFPTSVIYGVSECWCLVFLINCEDPLIKFIHISFVHVRIVIDGHGWGIHLRCTFLAEVQKISPHFFSFLSRIVLLQSETHPWKCSEALWHRCCLTSTVHYLFDITIFFPPCQ